MFGCMVRLLRSVINGSDEYASSVLWYSVYGFEVAACGLDSILFAGRAD
jgi:hypothetical protein